MSGHPPTMSERPRCCALQLGTSPPTRSMFSLACPHVNRNVSCLLTHTHTHKHTHRAYVTRCAAHQPPVPRQQSAAQAGPEGLWVPDGSHGAAPGPRGPDQHPSVSRGVCHPAAAPGPGSLGRGGAPEDHAGGGLPRARWGARALLGSVRCSPYGAWVGLARSL